MATPLRILILEDDPDDAKLTIRQLREQGLEFDHEVASTEAEYVARLDDPVDVILADYHLPQFNALRALDIARERGLDTPLIVVTGYLGDELAAACIRRGATDFLLKDRLARLGVAVTGAIERTNRERALRESDERLRSVLGEASVIVFALDSDGTVTFSEGAGLQALGLGQGEAVGQSAFALYADQPDLQRDLSRVLDGERFTSFADLGGVMLETNWTPQFDAMGEPSGAVAVSINVTERVTAERALRGSERLLAQAQQIAHTGSWEWNIAANEGRWSDEVYRIFGRDPAAKEDRWQTFVQAVQPDDRDHLRSVVSEALQGAHGYYITLRILRPDGTQRIVHSRGEVTLDDDGQPIQLLGTLQDVTEAEHARRLERLLTNIDRTALEGDSIDDAILRACQYVSESYDFPLSWIGLKELDGTISIHGAWGPERDVVDDLVVRWDDTLEGGGPSGQAIQLASPQSMNWDDPGHHPWRFLARRHQIESVCALPLKAAGGAVIGVLTVSSRNADEFDREAIEPLQLVAARIGLAISACLDREQLELKSLALDGAANAIFITDSDGTIEWVNRGFTRLTGYAADEAIGQTPRMLKSGRQSDQFYEQVWRKIKTGRVFRGEMVNRNKDGLHSTVVQTITPVLDGRGEVSHFLAIQDDVTAEVAATHELAASEQRLRLVMETVTSGIVLLDSDGRALLFNDALCRILGYSREALEGTPLAHLFQPNDRSRVIEQVAAHVRGGDIERYVMKLVRRDGRTIDADISACPFSEGGVVIGSLVEVRDVSEELALRRTVERAASEVSAILDSTQEAIVFADEDGTILRANLAAGAMFGWLEDELVGQNVAVFVAEPARSLHGQDPAHHLASGEASTSLGLVIGTTREVVGVRRDGTEFPVDVSVAEIEREDGSRGFTAVIRDITERREAERVRELRHQVTVRNEFLATMSHELRTPLNSILGFGQLLAENTAGDLSERQQTYVEQILGSGRHLLDLINDLLDISRIDAGTSELRIAAVAPAAVIAEVTAGLASIAGDKGIELRTRLDDAPARVHADERQLRQALLNLVANAIKFTVEGHVEVRVSEADGDLVIEVGDTGIGIAEDDLERVFQPFTQVDTGDRRRQGGTGLGLAITSRIAQMHGGTLTLQSTLGSGSTFTLRLPIEGPPTEGSQPE